MGGMEVGGKSGAGGGEGRNDVINGSGGTLGGWGGMIQLIFEGSK